MLCYVLNANRQFQCIYTELALEVFNNFQFLADGVIRIKPFVEQNKCQTLCKKHYKKSESRSVMSDTLRTHDYTVQGILHDRILEWVAFPFSRDLPNPGTEPRSPALQADSLPAEPQGKPKLGMRLNRLFFPNYFY